MIYADRVYSCEVSESPLNPKVLRGIVTLCRPHTVQTYERAYAGWIGPDSVVYWSSEDPKELGPSRNEISALNAEAVKLLALKAP